MSIRQLIAQDLASIEDPSLLNKIFDYVQTIKKMPNDTISNRDAVLRWAGCIDNNTADMLQKNVMEEFNKIEGDW